MRCELVVRGFDPPRFLADSRSASHEEPWEGRLDRGTRSQPYRVSKLSKQNREVAEDAAEFIGESLEVQHSLDDLAARAGLSSSHFQRIFTEQFGESPLQYAKRLRLERSVFFLRNSEEPVTQVALESGYEAHEAFSRAFRRNFGMSPRDFRKISRGRQRQSTSAFEVVELQETRLAAIRRMGSYNDAQLAFRQLAVWASPHGLLQEQNLLGVYWDDQEVTDPEKTRFDVALALPNDFQLAADARNVGVKERFLPAGHYACVEHRGPSSVRDTYERVFRDWYPQSGWAPDVRPMLVEYDERSDPWRASLFVAVRRA